MIRLISRMLAVTLAATVAFSTAAPEAVFAAALSEEDPSAGSGPVFETELSDEITQLQGDGSPDESAGKPEIGGYEGDDSSKTPSSPGEGDLKENIEGTAQDAAQEGAPPAGAGEASVQDPADPAEEVAGETDTGRAEETEADADTEEETGDEIAEEIGEEAGEETEEENGKETEEKTAEETDEETGKETGRTAFLFDSTGGVVKVVIERGEVFSEDADQESVRMYADEEDPEYILEKKEDGSVYVTERGGIPHEAAVSEEGYVLEIEESAGTRITAFACAAEGYKVSEFAVSTDSGGAEETGFERGAENFSYTAETVPEECRVFTVSFESDHGQDEQDEAAGAEKSGSDPVKSAAEPAKSAAGTAKSAAEPAKSAAGMAKSAAGTAKNTAEPAKSTAGAAKLLTASGEPDWTKGGGGIWDISDQISIQHRDVYRYWYDQYGFLGGDEEDWSTFTYGMYVNGELVGWSVCVDPKFDGRDLDGVWAGAVYRVSAPMFVKALYYGAGGPGENVIAGITGTDDYGANDIVTHVAASEIYARLGYSQSDVGDGFIDASDRLAELVYSFVSAIEDLPVPENYYGYVTEKNGYSNVGYPRQNFAFGSYTLTEGMVKVRKVSGCTAVSGNNRFYSLKDARYWVYNSRETALARGDDGWVSGGTLVTDENGVSNEFALSPGTYYLIEGSAPSGFGLSDTVYSFTISNGSTTEVTVTDQPAAAPASLTIDKKCRGKEGKNINSLEGTQFTIGYYNGYYDASTLPSAPTRSWVIKTVKENGKYVAKLSSGCLVSGTLFQKDGVPVLPLGTISIRETKAVRGYINDGKFGGADQYIGQIRYNAGKAPYYAELVDIRGKRSTDGGFEVLDTAATPSIGTKALDAASRTKTACAGGKVTIEDTVSYRNLIVGDEYTVAGKLVDKQTGKILKDAGGSEVTAKKKFKAETMDGAVTLSFTFEADSTLAGKSAVAFESLLFEGKELAAHADITDEAQTVRFPKIVTSAVNPQTDDHIMPAAENAQITDTVSYENLIPGTQYRLRGSVMDRSTGKVLVTGDEETVAEKTFTPEKGSGQTEISFYFDASGLEGRELVVFEELYVGKTLIAGHKDLSDAGQTVRVPGVETDVCDRDTSEKNSLAAQDRVIIDSISYNGLISGKTYKITGEVRIRKEDAESFEDAEIVPAEIVSAQGKGKISFDSQKVTFVPEGEENKPVSGVLLVGFKVDTSGLAGEDLVVGESVRYKGMDIAVHRDIRDDRQTDHIPDGHTETVDASTGIKNTLAADGRILKDTFRYENLIPGRTYRFTGRVMVKTGTDEEGADLLEEIPSFMTDESGAPVENGFVEFVPEEKDGSLELYFSVNAAELENRDVTVYETVTLDGAPVIVHEVLDGTQTVYVPEGGTTVIDSETGDRIAFPDEEVTLIDTLLYRNLIPGKEYRVTGRVMKKKTAEEIPSSLTEASLVSPDGEEDRIPGGEISVAENIVTFTPDSEDGALALTFVLDASLLKGEDAVVFERVSYNDQEVIVHENIDDETQTVHLPDGHTTAADSKTDSHNLKAGGNVIIKDRVYYENLIPGADYVIHGKVMLKPSGKEKIRELEAKMVDKNGNEIKEKVFTPREANGTEEVYFAVSTDELAGRSAVVFERMEFVNPGTLTRTMVFCHEDSEDEEQTVSFTSPEVEKDKPEEKKKTVNKNKMVNKNKTVNKTTTVEKNKTVRENTAVVQGKTAAGSRTGDENKPLLWIFIPAASAAGIWILKKRSGR